MKNKKLVLVLCGVLMLALGAGIGAYAATNFGTQSDPLVAKSYLDDVLTPQLQAEFDARLSEQVQAMEKEISSAASSQSADFVNVTLSQGQVLKGKVGCEIILRSGNAISVSASGLSDVTEGTSLASGAALTANHLCLVGTDAEGLTAASAVSLLVRGGYTIG